MQEKQTNQIDDYYQEITINTQKGEAYRIRFADDDTQYIGIPIRPPQSVAKSEEDFQLRVLEPEDKRGVLDSQISQIEFMEKAPTNYR